MTRKTQCGIAIACALVISMFSLGVFYGAKTKPVRIDPGRELALYLKLRDLSEKLDSYLIDIFIMDGVLKAHGFPRVLGERKRFVDEFTEVYGAYQVAAREYNNIMAESGYRFSDPKRLPQGIEKVLPRFYEIFVLELGHEA